MALQWLPCHASGVFCCCFFFFFFWGGGEGGGGGSVLVLIGPVSVYSLGGVESLICNFYLSVVARKLVEHICPWDLLACCWDVKQSTTTTRHLRGRRDILLSAREGRHISIALLLFNCLPTTVANALCIDLLSTPVEKLSQYKTCRPGNFDFSLWSQGNAVNLRYHCLLNFLSSIIMILQNVE